MKIAVIGAGGFIGGRIVEHLHLATRHAVVPIVRAPSRLALPARFALPWQIGDALDSDSLTRALNGCDAVVHAALGDPRQIEAMPGILAQAAARANVPRVVYLSTASVHGQAPAPGTHEGTPLHTRHALDYNNAKVRAERAFFNAATRQDLEAFALRPGVVYGPRSRWITDAASDLRLGRAWLFREGDGICNGIYVDNLVSAVTAALVAPATVAGAYLVGDKETITWRDFYDEIGAGLALRSPLLHRIDQAPAFPRSPAVRLQRLVGHPGVQRLLPFVPSRLKQVTKRLVAAANAPVRPAAWALPTIPGPRITEELALLQQCRWKFPHDHAARQLGYRPPVSFAEAVRRSLSWLAFAEGRSA